MVILGLGEKLNLMFGQQLEGLLVITFCKSFEIFINLRNLKI
jgi:hypothetical protein